MHGSPDLAQTYARADLATNYLLGKLPDLRLPNLDGLGSGTPVRAWVIDGDGDLSPTRSVSTVTTICPST